VKSRLLAKLAGVLPAPARFKRAMALHEAQKYTEAFPLLAGLASEGDTEAQYQVGRCYLRALGVPPNKAEALHWLEQAATKGHTEAQYTLASLAVQGGLDVDGGLFAPAGGQTASAGPDFEKAAYWAGMAEEKSPPAQALLA
jgi:uncharacterized protein